MHKLETLQETFEYMKKQSEHGVNGILRIKGKKKLPINRKNRKKQQPVKIISAITHGCEINGLAALKYIINHRTEIEKKLSGELLLIINNIQAAENHFSGKTKSNGAKWHWCDQNMNRLPENTLSLKSPAYEIKRAQELSPWYREATSGLDLHSLPKKGSAMIIDIKGTSKKLNQLAGNINIPIRIQKVSSIQKGKSIGFFYGGLHRSIPVIEVECGKNLTKKGEKIAIKAALHFIFPKKIYQQKSYTIYWALRFQDLSYSLPKLFRNFEKVKKGQIIAQSKHSIIRAPKESYTLFTRTKKKYTHTQDLQTEVFFLAEAEKN